MDNLNPPFGSHQDEEIAHRDRWAADHEHDVAVDARDWLLERRGADTPASGASTGHRGSARTSAPEPARLICFANECPDIDWAPDQVLRKQWDTTWDPGAGEYADPFCPACGSEGTDTQVVAGL